MNCKKYYFPIDIKKFSFLLVLIIFLFSGCSQKEDRTYEEQLVYDFETIFSISNIYENGTLKDFDSYVASAKNIYETLKQQGYSEASILTFIDSNFSYIYPNAESSIKVLGRDLLNKIEFLDSKKAGYENLKKEFESIQNSNPLASATNSQKIIVCKNRVFSENYINIIVLRYSTYDSDKEIVRAISYVFDSDILKISSAGVKYGDINSIDFIPQEYLDEGWVINNKK